MKLMHRLVDAVWRVAPQKNINSIDYWENGVDDMVKEYLRHRTIAALDADERRLRFVFNEVSQKGWLKILEVGCGFGYTLKKFACKFPHINFYGCDFSKNLIEGGGRGQKSTWKDLFHWKICMWLTRWIYQYLMVSILIVYIQADV